MTFSASQKLERFTGFHPMLSESGSKDSDSEPSPDSQQTKPEMNDTLPSGQAHSREHSFTFGADQKPLPYSTACVIHEPFTVASNGSIGQMILNADGNTLAWTTDPWVAQVICKLLTENDGLLR